MSTIFPGSASVGQVYNNYTFDGTAWNINGIDLTENYLEESSASTTYQTKLTAGSGLSLNGSTLGVNPGAMLNTIVDGTSGNSYGLVGTSTYLDVKDTNGYNKEIELDIAAVESQLVTDGFLKNSSASTTYLTQVSASSTYVSKTTIPAFRLYQSTPQTITTATNTALLFDSEDLDTDNGHSTVTNTSRYTATVAGWYMVTGTLQIAHNTTGNRIVFIRKNGSTTINQVGRQTSSATNTLGLQIGTMVYLNGTTDYLELMAFQSSGGNLDTLTANPSYFEGFWVRS